MIDEKFLLGLRNQSVYSSTSFKEWLSKVKSINTYAYTLLPTKHFSEKVRSGIKHGAVKLTSDDAEQIANKVFKKYMAIGDANTPMEELIFTYFSKLATSVFMIETGWGQSNNFQLFGFFGAVRHTNEFGKNYMDYLMSEEFVDGSLYLATSGFNKSPKVGKTHKKQRFMVCSTDVVTCITYISEYMISKFFAYVQEHDRENFNEASSTAVFLKNGGHDEHEVNLMSAYLNSRARAILNYWFNGGETNHAFKTYTNSVFSIMKTLI